MGHTVNGRITASGTRLPSGGLVPGSSAVSYTYSYILPSLSGSYALYEEVAGQNLGLSPLDAKNGLIAWHRFSETSNYILDWSHNHYDAINYGTLPVLSKQGYGLWFHPVWWINQR